MGKWQDSAKQSIVNRNSDTSSQSNTANAGAKSSGSWQQQAKQSLDSRGYIPPENRAYEIKLNNGTNFGTVSYGAYKAIQNDTLDKYVPKNDDEKNTLDSFKTYVKEQAQKQEEKEKQNRINSNPVTKKYGIDPDNFTQKDFEKWAEEHGFEYRMGGNDLTGAEYKWLPKQKGGWKFWEVVPSKEEQSDKKALEALAENNQRKAASKTDKGAVSAAVVNAIDGLTFGVVNAYADWDAKRDYKKAGFDENDFVSYSQAQEKTNSEHKIASAAGNIAGSLVSLGGLSKAVGAATSGVKWIAKAPGWVQSAINSGITFAVQSGAETAFDGGNFEDVLKSAGINLVGGAVGGGVSGKVGSIGEKLLFDKGLQHKVIPEMIRTGVSSATFAGSKTASTYFLYPEDYRPTKEEMAKDITTAFAFGAISSGINTIKTPSQNKKYLDGLCQKMAADYESMAKANISGKDDTAGIQKFAKNVIGYSNAMEAYLTGKEYSATIDGETYTFTPNKVRLVGQDKYVNSILGEIDTIRNNANAVLNGIETPSAGTSTASAPTNTVSKSASAIAQAASVAVPNTNNDTASSDSSTPIVTSVAAAETVTPQNKSTVDTVAVPQTAVKTNASGELSEIMDSEPIATFTPETASNEIKRLENILIAKGADDTSRKEIIDTAVEIEKTLDGSDKNIRSVFNDVSKITSTAISEIQNQAGLSSAYWKLFGENFKTVPTGNAKENINLVTEYSNAYAEALKNNNPEKYNSVMLSADGQDLSSELPKTIMQNNIPNTVQNAGQYRLIATQIKNIINAADVQLESERNEIYGDDANTPVENNAETTEVQTVNEPKNITLTRMGDFYEAFGDEALELAEKLNLTPTYKTVNGVKTAMVGFPVHVLEKYQGTLGNDYNLVISDNATDTIADNTTATVQNQADTSGTDVVDHTKGVDGLKLIDAEKSTLLDGKTLVTGVYELNSDKDFNRKSYKKESFDVFIIKAPYVKSVDGTTYGHYGIAGDKANGYMVTYLPAGVGVAKADTQAKAKVLLEALENDLPELPLTIKAYADEYRCYGIDEAVKESVNNVVNSVTENTDEIILPLKNKKELISYLKNHKGDRIGVTYNNGTEEVRTIVSASDTAIVTEQADGQRGNLRAKANELSYTDDGFVYTSGNGVTVTYRFIDENTAESTEPATNAAETSPNTPFKLTDKCELITTKHTKTNDDLWVVTLKEKLSAEDYKTLNGKVKEAGGYYSKFAKTPDGKAIPGFIFKTEPTENELSVFNDFFDKTAVNDTPQAENSEATPDNADVESTAPETENKPDLKVGDVIEYEGKQWRVAQTGFNMSFENLDKSDKQSVFSHIGGMDNFKATHDYKLVSDDTRTDITAESEKNVTETQTKTEEALKKEPKSDIIKKNPTTQIADYVTDKLTDKTRLSAAVGEAIRSTLKSEISENSNLMGMLSDTFGGDGLDALTDEIIEYYADNKRLDDFEDILTDGGKKVYKALGKGKVRYSLASSNEDTLQSGVDAVQSAKNNAEAAKENFGTTVDFNEAGYLTVNGDLLDFSGRHWGGNASGMREVDHGDIAEVESIPYFADGTLWGSDAVQAFLNEGNIRIVGESKGINLSESPNNKQIPVLKDYIDYNNGEITVDITNESGYPKQVFEYGKGTSSAKIINDIENYFSNGTIPQISELNKFRYSVSADNVISVSTTEIPVKYSNINEARKAFVEYAQKKFPQNVININTRSEIGISRTDIDKFLSGNISLQKYATGFEIPELLRTAIKVGETENKKGKTGIIGYEYYDNSVNIDGKPFAVHIRVRNADMGNKYYGHTIRRDVEEIKIEPLVRNSDNKSVHSVNASSSDDSILSQDKSIVNSYNTENNKKYSESGELVNEQTRSGILSGNSGRTIDESTGKQDRRVSSYKQTLGGKTTAERKSTAKELTVKGYTEEVVNGNHKYTLIKDEGYNDDMRSIVSEAKAYGKEVGFFIGNAVRKFDGQRNFKIDGIKLSDNKILIRYDGTYSPQALLMHELVHTEWDNPEMQRAKDIILSDLSESDKKEILQNGRYKDYMELYNGDEDAVWEEFIADIFADMNKFSDSYIDTAVDYWYNDKVIDRYNPSEYIKSTDTGGNEAVLDNVGLGNEYSLNNHTPKIELSKQEYALVSKAVMAKNAGKADNELKPVDFVYAADEFYVYENHSIGEFSVINKYDVETEYDKIDDVKECVNNGTYTDRERLNRLIDDFRRGKGSHSRNNGRTENGRYAMADDRISGEQQRSNSIGHSSGIGANNKVNGVDFEIIPEEKHQLDDYVLRKNHSSNKLEKVDCKEIGNNFYVWENNSKTDYTVVNMIEIDGNEDLINDLREVVKNGTRGFTKQFGSAYEGRSGNGRRSNSMLNVVYQRRKSANGNGGISSEQSTDNTVGRSKESGRDKQTKYALSSNGKNADFWNEWIDKVKEYGAIPKGENPVRDVKVPKKISKNDVVSRFARTILEAGVTPEWSVSEFEKAVLDGSMTHEVITDKGAKKWAKEQIEYHGFKEVLNNWYVLSDSGKIGKKELALGMELYNQCITNKDTHNAMKISANLAAEATRAGQTVQACRLLKLMSPDGQLYYLEKSIQKMNDEFRQKIGEKYKDIELDENLMSDFLNETDEEKRNEVYDKICQSIANQIPATLLDKWNSWRYLAMLGNPRTHIRNIVGNAVFVPAVRLKNYVGAVIESVAKIAPENRTHSARKSKEAVTFAEKDFANMVEILQGENAKYAVTSDVEGKRTIFKTKWLETLRQKNFDFLEAEDMWFLKTHYIDALARLITARKLDVNNISSKKLDVLRAYAVKEAQAATYRDANALAEGINRLQRSMERNGKKSIRAASVLVEGVMPFKKTPLNIAKQGINYSPVGILNGLYETVKKHKDSDDVSADKIIDDFSKGITGTAIMLLGFWLASMGVLVGAKDKSKKEKEFDKMTGEQSYATKIAGHSYTIDWMTPSNLSLFIGAKLYDLTKDDFKAADVIAAASTLTEPLLELSVFSGVNGLIESAQYSDSEALITMASDMATSYLMQALPTLGGQISRLADGKKREYYYTDKNSNIPKGIQRLIGQASSKIPFASYLFEPSVDAWGREETYGNLFERAFENTVSPGYYAKENYTDVDRELKELFERTGESSVFPTTQQKYYVEQKVYYYMNAKDYTEAKKMRGQRSFELVQNLMDSSDYKGMSDEEKVKAIEKCYETAGKETKEKMIEKVKSKSR